jgi:putative PIN family toxin of toxin-antitoxin system
MIDSNIIFSAALYRKGGIASLLEEILRKFQICICDFSIEELQIVIQNKFPECIDEMEDFLNKLTYEFIYTPKKIDIENMPYVRDKKDYPILAAAISSDVDILLSGDKDLLTVEIGRPEILNSKNFREKYL